MTGTNQAERWGAEVDSLALGAEGSALAQGVGAPRFPALARAENRRASCPVLYTALYTASETIPHNSFAAPRIGLIQSFSTLLPEPPAWFISSVTATVLRS